MRKAFSITREFFDEAVKKEQDGRSKVCVVGQACEEAFNRVGESTGVGYTHVAFPQKLGIRQDINIVKKGWDDEVMNAFDYLPGKEGERLLSKINFPVEYTFDDGK